MILLAPFFRTTMGLCSGLLKEAGEQRISRASWSFFSIGLFCEMIPPLPALTAYNERLSARPANQKAGLLNWPPDRFPATQAE